MREYRGPYGKGVSNICDRIAGDAERQLSERFIESYVRFVTNKMVNLAAGMRDMQDVTNARTWFDKIAFDLGQRELIGDQAAKLEVVNEALQKQRAAAVERYATRVATEMGTKLGFPIRLDALDILDAKDLIDAKRIIGSLEKNLSNTVWEFFPEGRPTLGALGKMANKYGAVVNSLANGDVPAEVEIFFVPPKLAPDKVIASIFREVEVSIGENVESRDISRLVEDPGPVSLVKGGVDRPIQIKFRKTSSDRMPLQFLAQPANWGIVRLIREGKAERLESGSHWRIRIPLEDKQQKKSGDVIFEAVLKQALPKVQDWPKQGPAK